MQTEFLNKAVDIDAIRRESEFLGFTMDSEPDVGTLLATLASMKPMGRFLELGTGTGHGAAFLLMGMDSGSTLDTVDVDESLVAVAERHIGHDPRVVFHLMDGVEYLNKASESSYDFIFADTWPGKFSHLERALSLLAPGGLYFIDDLHPRADWPDGHAAKVVTLIETLERHTGFMTVKLDLASGVMLAVSKS